MSVQLIKGRSGSGKTHLLYTDLIKEAVEYSNRLYLVVVPEQFTLATQKLLTTMHPAGALINIDILSFDRLALRILEEGGAEQLPLLDDTAKSFILRRLISKYKESLSVLGAHPDKPGFIDELKSFVSEAEQYFLSPGDLDMYAERAGEGALALKLKDMAFIYGRYEEFISEKYVSARTRLKAASDIAAKSAALDGAYVVFDGFTGFTPIQCELLRGIMQRASDIRITLTIDPKENVFREGERNDLFYLSRKTARKVISLAEESGAQMAPDVVVTGEKGRFKESRELSFLEENIFGRRANRAKLPDIKDSAISISSAPTPMDELAFCARRIRQLVNDDGYDYRDIAVVTGDLSSYGGKAARVFGDYDIPLFVDETLSITNERFVRCIRAIFAILNDDFSYRSVFSYLRCGFTDISMDDIDVLENYALGHNIKGWKKWSSGFSDENAEAVRLKVAKIFAPVREFRAQRGKTVLSITRFIYEHLTESGITANYTRWISRMEEKGETDTARRQLKVYEFVMKLFEKIVIFNEDERMSVKDYAALFEAGMKGASVGKLPAGGNEVVLGDVERTRLSDIKVLFVLGANDGVLPKSVQEGGIISEEEREFIRQKGLEIADTATDKLMLQNFYLYLTLTKPSKRLYISYCASDMQGDSMRRSYVVDRVMSLFEDKELTQRGTASSEISYESPRGALSWFAEKYREAVCRRETSPEFFGLYRWYEDNDEFSEVVSGIRQSYERRYLTPHITKEKAGKLFGAGPYSVTRLESFAECEFLHFIKYGLKLKEREIYTFKPADLGNIYHDAVSLFMTDIVKKGGRIHDLDSTEIERLSAAALEDTLSGAGYSGFFDGASGEFVKKRIREVFLRTADTVAYQIKEGEFEPLLCEYPFDLILPGENAHGLHGRIDRIDLARLPARNLVRVIDYKSSARKLNIDRIYAGTDIQIMIYLAAAIDEIRKKHPGMAADPAGAYFYGMTDPIIKDIEPAQANAQERISAAIRTKLRLSGISCADDDCILATDRGAASHQKKSSDVAAFGIKNDGGFTAASSVLDSGEFSRLIDNALVVAGRQADEMLMGKAAVSPVKESAQKTSCTYCPYRALCAFDPSDGIHSYRRLESVARKVREELEPDTGNDDNSEVPK